MADYFLIDGSRLNASTGVVVHSDVPATNNAAAQPWRDVLVADKGETTSVLPPAMLEAAFPGRQAELDTGEKYEWQFSASYDANSTNPEKLAVIENQIQIREATVQTELLNRLRWYGQTGTVV